MTSQAVPELGEGQRTARNILLGIPPRMFQEARNQPAGATLARASHPQFGILRASPGDRIYLCAFADGKLALVGRLVLDSGRPRDVRKGAMVGRAPFTACRADRIVPHCAARGLRSTSGDALRFARATDYELHPGALLKPLELSPDSAESLDLLLADAPSPVQIALTASGAKSRATARRSKSRSADLVVRDRSIMELAETGALFSEIAKRFEISRQRVSQIVRAGERGPEAGARASTQMSSEELLSAYAALVEARGSAGTRGERQGATRRIRSIEAALRERGVEFEPAALERRARRSAPMPSTADELLAAHAAWVEARASAQTGGERQGASRRLRKIEAALLERSIAFEPAKLQRPSRRWAPMPSTPEDLLAAHAGAVEARESAGTPGTRAGATKRIRSIEAALRDHGIEFEPAKLQRPSRRPPPELSTAEELLSAYAALVEARGSAGTRGERQGATRRIRSIEAALRERGVEFEPAALERRARRSAPMPSTADELLAAHAAWVEARASAQTGGERQGASRRLRKIEAALLERSIAFEPAKLQRPSRRWAPMPSTPEDLLAAHAGAVEARESAGTPGTRAGATKRIRSIEAALRDHGIEFEPAKLQRPSRRWAPMPSTPEDLLAAHAGAVEARESAGTPGTRAGATKRIRSIEAALRDHGIEFEPAKLQRPSRRPPPELSTAEELLSAYAALVEARGSAGTRGERQGATRRIRSIEAALRERGVEFEPAALERRARRSAPMPSTADELLAAHAAWVEARASAQTGGERQGASRRLRKIEAALLERSIAFEPAKLQRPSRRPPPELSTAKALLSAQPTDMERESRAAPTPAIRINRGASPLARPTAPSLPPANRRLERLGKIGYRRLADALKRPPNSRS